MKKIFHASSTRGEANHGWLHAKHSFSFANYFDPKRIQFGALRVLNDDIIAPGMGFGSHPHDNMEIITIPLEGALEHKDSMDNIGVIEADEIQVMSAGTGIFHSEYNKNKDKEVKVLQLWVLPKEKNVTPRYDQKSIKELKKINPNLNKLGILMNRHHNILKNDLSITVPLIDKMIDLAIENGAYGAKIIGSGGGGSILILSNEKDENRIIDAMYNIGAKEVIKANVSCGIFSL